MKEAIDQYWPEGCEIWAESGMSSSWIDDPVRSCFLTYFLRTYPMFDTEEYIPGVSSATRHAESIDEVTGEISFHDGIEIQDTTGGRVKTMEQFAQEQGPVSFSSRLVRRSESPIYGSSSLKWLSLI